MTIDRIWNEAVRRHADLPALGWVDAAPWTFKEVDRRVKNLQARFSRQGLTAGDRVALWSSNHPAWGIAYLGITTGSLVVVPLLPEFCVQDAANVLIHADAKLLITSRSLATVWNQWLEQAPEDKRRILSALKVEILEELTDSASVETVGQTLPRPLPTDLAALIYTSGTTGASKGVMLTHENIVSNVVAAAPIPGFVPGDKMLSVLPLAHTYECTLGFLIPMHEGVSVSYLAKPPSPAVLLPALASVRPQAMLTVPLFMEKIYRQKVLPGLNKGLLRILRKIPGLGWTFTQIAGAKLRKTFGGRLKFFGVGGAPLAPEVARFLHRCRFPYAIGYGLTETSPLIAGHLKGRLYTTGRILEGVQVKIAEPKNSQGAGEILVKGPNVMAGYYKSETQTAEAFTTDGWFRTGDLGLFDTHSQLRIMGRSKNLILGPSGENIYPEAIEALINQDRLVSESLVLQRGPEIVAKVFIDDNVVQDQLRTWAARHGKSLTAWGEDTSKAVDDYLAELKHQINQQLSRFSRLSFLEIQLEPFEKTATLKIKRYLYA